MSKELIKWLRRRVTYTDGDTRKEVENRIEELETERDQLREQVKMLRDALERAIATCFDITSYEQVMSNPSHLINKALAATDDHHE